MPSILVNEIMPLSFKHFTSTRQLSRSEMDAILEVSKEMESVLNNGGSDLLQGKILASLFYEPSTRTRLSFEAAMHRLGGEVITADGLQFSSLYKGETIQDTMRVVSQYADIIAMRHPEQGSADKATEGAEVPFINAGDGPGQHPTQAVLDMYTIHKERGSIDNLHITMVGDLKFGRTVHSLSFLLGLYDNVHFTLVSPPELRMPEKVTACFAEKGIEYHQTEDISKGLESDVIYMTRVQEERFADAAEYERLRNRYILTADHIQGKDITVMHPLPRREEIAPEVDALPNAAYFRQVQNGVVTRMALLAMLLGKA